MSWCALFLLLAAEPAAAPEPTPTPVPAVPRRLGDVKLKAPPSEAGRTVSSASGSATSSSRDLPEREEVPKLRTVLRVPRGGGEHLDHDGHGETWWRERAARARRAIAAAEEVLRAAHDDVVAAGGEAGAGITAQVVPSHVLAVLLAREEAAREKLAAAERAWEALREQARHSDAYPGWLR